MIFKEITANDKNDYKLFLNVVKEIYKDYPYSRSTEDELILLLTKGPTIYHTHADVKLYLIYENDELQGRFCFINDKKLADFVQVAFFEAKPGLGNLCGEMLIFAKKVFPQCSKIIVGLNGHLNYGAGFLASHFDKVPVFGLPYTHEYYTEYFKDLRAETMVSFRYPTKPFYEFFKKTKKRYSDDRIDVRFMNKRELTKEVETYTYIDNNSFDGETLYWSNRLSKENFELFHPFRYLMQNENLIFAEHDGKPVGFLLWYPDFNQLVKSSFRGLNLLDVLKFKISSGIDTIRFTEIAVLKSYRKTRTAYMLMSKISELSEKYGYTWLEGGFIFERNKESILTASRYYERITGIKSEPYRKYVMYEGRI